MLAGFVLLVSLGALATTLVELVHVTGDTVVQLMQVVFKTVVDSM